MTILVATYGWLGSRMWGKVERLERELALAATKTELTKAMDDAKVDRRAMHAQNQTSLNQIRTSTASIASDFSYLRGKLGFKSDER